MVKTEQDPTEKALSEVWNRLKQFAGQGCNGNVVIHFAAGIPRKIDYNSTEALNSK